jgi:hypothetical protein
MTCCGKLRGPHIHATASATAAGGVFLCHPGQLAANKHLTSASIESNTSLPNQRNLLANWSTWHLSFFITPALITNKMD